MTKMDSTFSPGKIFMIHMGTILIMKVLIRMEVTMMIVVFTYHPQIPLIFKRMKPGRSMQSITMNFMDLKLMKMSKVLEKMLPMKINLMMTIIGKEKMMKTVS